jgi:flagellar FliJ protein
MKRAQRLDHFRDGLESSEKEHRGRLAAAEGRLADARTRLGELQRYREEYQRGLGDRSAAGIGATALRDYHAFVARIDEAVRQQAQLLARIEVECDFERQRWNEAATRSRAVASVVDRWRQEERVTVARVEQRESDEWARQAGLRPRLETP